jgi:hypothetical protein
MVFRCIEGQFRILVPFQVVVVVVVVGGGVAVDDMVVAVVVLRDDAEDFRADAVTGVFQKVVAGAGDDVDFQVVVVAAAAVAVAVVAAAAVECGCRIAVGNRSDDADAVVGCRSRPYLPMLSSSRLKSNCQKNSDFHRFLLILQSLHDRNNVSMAMSFFTCLSLII